MKLKISFRSRIGNTIEILGRRSNEWKNAARRLNENQILDEMIYRNRAFQSQLDRIHSQRDFVDLINEFGTGYLMNEGQFNQLARKVYFRNEDRIRKILKQILNDLRRI